MLIDIIAFVIVLFIASCAALYLWITHPRGLIAGEHIKRGDLVYRSADGKIHPATRQSIAIGFAMSMECDSGEQ